MLLTTSGGSSFAVTLANEQATERFVADIATALEPGDLVTPATSAPARPPPDAARCAAARRRLADPHSCRAGPAAVTARVAMMRRAILNTLTRYDPSVSRAHWR